MLHSNWTGGALAIGLLLLAAGCEDLPTNVAGGLPAANAPGALPSGYAVQVPLVVPSANPSASPSVTPLPTPTPTPTPSATPTPTPTVGATPTPLSTVAPTPSPSPSPTPTLPPAQGSAGLNFVQPQPTADFTVSQGVLVQASAPAGVVIQEMDLYYDNRPLVTQIGGSSSLSLTNWDPNQANSGNSSPDSTPVPYGNHKLTARVVTTAGIVTVVDLPFSKPLIFKGWVATFPVANQAPNTAPQQLPPLPPARAYLQSFGWTDRLVSFFGQTGASPTLTPISPPIQALNTEFFAPQWGTQSAGSLVPHAHAAVANAVGQAYVIGGQAVDPNTGALQATPNANVTLYDLSLQTASAGPSLPGPVYDAAALVFNSNLYVIGGSTNGMFAGASPLVYRLALNSDGTPKPGATWQTAANLPFNIGLMGAAATVVNNQIYVAGGITGADGNGNALRSQSIMRYDNVNDAWSQVGLLPVPLSHAAATALGGDLWIFGGFGSGNQKVLGDGLRFGTTSQAIKAFPNATLNPAVGAAGTAVLNNQFYLLGGMGADPSGNLVPVGNVLRANIL